MGELLLHPVAPFLVGAVLVWFAPRRVAQVAMIVAPIVALLQLALLDAGTTVTLTYLGFELEPFRVDRLALAFGWVFAIAALIGGIYGLTTLKGREPTSILAYAGAAMGVVFAGDLMTVFFFWEIKAVASSFVIFSRRGGNSNRAGTRYLFTHLVGGKLLLAGAIWQQSTTGSLAFDAMELSGGTMLILLAFLVSAAVPPLHAWLPDAYPEASVAGTVFLSAFTTKSAVYALARGFPGLELLLWLGVMMAVYGVIYAMLENDIRRLLSYHIVSQVGFMVAAIGVGTEFAINGAVAHAFAHILYKGLLLMGVGAVIHATGRSKMTELGGLANSMRSVFTLYMVGAVSISSLPLFSGFVSKEMSVAATSAEGFTVAVILLKVVSVGTFLSTGLKLPFGTWFASDGAGPRDAAAHPRLRVGPVPMSMFIAMGIGAGLNLLIGVYPAVLYDLMPHTVDYVPYSVDKVIEKLQILGFTGLGFWILIDRLQAKAKINRDVDWFYRRLPKILMGRPTPPRGPDETAPSESAWTARGDVQRAGRSIALAQGRLEGRLPAIRGSEPPLYPTWVLGAVLMSTILLLLVLTLATT